jgi:predicted DNA-binding transcriptional regulator AlpA
MEAEDKSSHISLISPSNATRQTDRSNKNMTSTTDELLTVQEAAAVLGVGVQRMYNLRNLGHGPVSYRRGRRLVYPRSGLVAFLARELRATLKGGEGV